MAQKLAIAILLIGLTMGIAALGLSWWPNDSNTTTNSPPVQGQPIEDQTPLILHSVQSAEGLINSNLTLPNSALVGPSLKIVGVRINEGPPQWSTTIYVWDRPFSNGTTTIPEILTGTGIALVESPAPAGTDNQTLAQSLGVATPVCSTNAGITTCQTSTESGSSYITSQNGVAILVNPRGNSLTLLDASNHEWVSVLGESYTVNQLLSFVNPITLESTSAAG